MQEEQNQQIPQTQGQTEAQASTAAPHQRQVKPGPEDELIHNIYKTNPMHLTKIIAIIVTIIVIVGGTLYLRQRTSHHGVVEIEQNQDQEDVVVKEDAVTTEFKSAEE